MNFCLVFNGLKLENASLLLASCLNLRLGDVLCVRIKNPDVYESRFGNRDYLDCSGCWDVRVLGLEILYLNKRLLF